MQSMNILDIKPFMQLLFQTNVLDQYQFVSANIRTDMSYALDGHINCDFFDEDELSSQHIANNTYLPWQLAKEKVFLLIKGKRTPSLLKIVLKANSSQVNNLLESTKSSLNPNDIDGLFLNISFLEKQLNVTCGISYNIFTLDKQIEEEYLANLITLFKSNNIVCQ